MIKTLLKSVREFKKTAFITIFAMIGEVVMEILIPFVMAGLIDEGLGNAAGTGDMAAIMRYGLILIGCSLLSLLFGVMGSLLGSKAGTGFARNLRHDMFEKIQTFSFANIDKFSTSSIITRLTTDVSNVQMLFTMSIRIAIRMPMTMIISVVMLFLISWKIALIVLASIPIIIIGLALIAKKVLPVFRRMFKRYDKLNLSVQENLHGIRVVKGFVREEHETEKFKKASGEIMEDGAYANKILSLNQPFMSAVMYIIMMLICFLGARFIVGGEAVSVSIMGDVFTTGLLNSTFSYAMQIMMTCMGLSMIFVFMTMSSESMRRIAEILQEETTIKNCESPKEDVEDGSIEFDHVNFSYSNDKDHPCLKDVNLKIPSGATVGIIGGTGSGKTTLVSLISRLYDVTEGSVKVGGTDVREYDMVKLRDAVSVVLQKNLLFSGTIKENMRWGNPDATDEEIVEACRLAAADGFIDEFPDKYDTYIEQGGTNVSGGQKQRLCIARALLKNPKVLILDDSTSAVDTATDAKIRDAFRTMIPNTTKLIVAQRISSVEAADMIIVLNNGAVDDVGTHEELLARNTIYKEVYTSQKKGGEENG